MQGTHTTEIWTKSLCLDHEDHINHKIKSLLLDIGFKQTSHPRIFKKDHRTVIVCLVDDILSCSNDYEIDIPYQFDRHTTVITDNHIICPVTFNLIKVPASFFGIYSYSPVQRNLNPTKDFSFQINRLDARRFQLLLDLVWRTSVDLGHVNFNCEDRTYPHLSVEESFSKQWTDLGETDKQKLEGVYNKLSPMMPLRNYDIEFDAVSTQSWVNMIVETYGSDNVISLSEKIFRALVTPAPWTVYAGRYTVAYLESLGFDCMIDLVDHNHYDQLKEVENKIRIFNWKSLEISRYLKSLDIEQIRQRCIKASKHNQSLLEHMRNTLDKDFTQWLDTLPSQLETKTIPWKI